MDKRKKILVLRTAKMQVVNLLMESLGGDDSITFLAQSNIVGELKKIYPFAEVISIKDTYFSYDSFCKNVHLNSKYDYVYILASGVEFAEYEEVFEIVEHIKCKKIVLFNKNGIASVERCNVFKRIKEYLYFVFVKIFLRIEEFRFGHFGKNYRF